eukprot:TRINITY_DN3706_c0_g1_i1.p1 TRINITY_DN3706_c0_g1~~TRINITY_DN3706_c0_g1_i1.p1  ORF type:complete len:274 (-),score=57.61 TRINITY_DN3706_c0_g1_i1:1144-1965(-)
MGGLKLGLEAQAKFDEAKIHPDKSGYLDKKGAKRKNWNNRWFVLKDNYLFYCKTEKSLPQGIINLHGCTVSKIEGPNTRQFSFSLLAPKSVSVDAKWTNRTYLMAARNPDDWKAWMETLEGAGRKSVERAQAAKAAGLAASPSITSKSENDAPQKTEPDSDSSDSVDAEPEEPAPAQGSVEAGPLPIKREESKGELRPRRKEESSSGGESGSEDEAPKPVKKDEDSGTEEPRPEAKKHRHKDKKERREKKERKEKRKERKQKKESSDSAEESA